MNPVLWQPSAERIEQALLSRFQQTLTQTQTQGGVPEGRNYAEFHAWSVREPAMFWNALWDFCGVIGERRGPVLEGTGMPGARFFPQARLNFAENLLERGQAQACALHYRDETGQDIRLTRSELKTAVARMACAFRACGLSAGDRVAAMLPNRPETVIAMLATTSLGAVWSSCSPDFGAAGVLDRFGQIKPSVFLACSGYAYGGKHFDTRAKALAVRAELGELKGAFLLDPCAADAEIEAPGFAPWSTLSAATADPLNYVRRAFNDPLYILYSSGTTGAPKCIVHGIGGTLLQHLKEHQLQADIRPGDPMFYYTTCGWMMWNWLVSGLASEASVLLFDGSPFSPSPMVLFDFIEQTEARFFGVSAKFIDALKSRGLRPADHYALKHLRSIASTGSPLVAESFAYCYEAIKRDVAVQSISGGTDIVSCFVLGNPWQAVHAGEIQGKGLGMAVDVCDAQGRSLPTGEKGDLICRQPFPSMPIGFWNDADGSRYRRAYFETIAGVWHHGDYAEITPQGGLIIHGRSDATLNPGGVRIGTAEIYRQVEQIPGITESLAIGQRWQDDVRIILFVILEAGVRLDLQLEQQIRQRIRRGASPRHVPAKIIQVSDFPRTRSGKLAELAVRAMIEGEEVKNVNALANPESLQLFAAIDSLSQD